MKRTGIVVATAIVACLLLALSQPAAAQTENQTTLDLRVDLVSNWENEEAKVGGRPAEGQVYVEVCWEEGTPAANPNEGGITVEVDIPPSTDQLQIRTTDDTTINFNFPLYHTVFDEDNCRGPVEIHLDFFVMEEFEGTIEHTWEFTATASANGDTGTFTVPSDESTSAPMQVTYYVDPFEVPNENNGNGPNGPSGAPTNDSPAPGVAVLLVLTVAAAATLRRRR